MQPTILVIRLVIMAVTLVLILRAILRTTGPEPDAAAPKMRTRLIWVMIVFGMILSLFLFGNGRTNTQVMTRLS